MVWGASSKKDVSAWFVRTSIYVEICMKYVGIMHG
jgi:hypothetical protein